MNYDDFCTMRRRKQLAALTKEETLFLKPLNQRSADSERALLLLHGFSSTPAVYRCLLPEILGYDAIVCPALSGHAKSIDAFSASTVEDWRNTANTSCMELCNEYKKVDVLGLSLGGLLACELSQHFSLNRLFLLAPALKLKMPVGFLLLLAKVLKNSGFYQFRNFAGNLLTEKQAEITYRRLPITAIIGMLSLAKNYQWMAPSCPIELFLGAADDVVASTEVEKLFSPLPNANIHWLENSAHVLPLDNDFKVIAKCINDYRV